MDMGWLWNTNGFDTRQYWFGVGLASYPLHDKGQVRIGLASYRAGCGSVIERYWAGFGLEIYLPKVLCGDWIIANKSVVITIP
jgi:hypothetical protein